MTSVWIWYVDFDLDSDLDGLGVADVRSDLNAGSKFRTTVRNSLTQVAGVQPIPAYERLSQKKITLAGHLILGVGVGGVVGQVRGLVDREINCKK